MKKSIIPRLLIILILLCFVAIYNLAQKEYEYAQSLETTLENMEAENILSEPTIGNERGKIVVSFFYKNKKGERSVISIPKEKFNQFLTE